MTANAECNRLLGVCGPRRRPHSRPHAHSITAPVCFFLPLHALRPAGAYRVDLSCGPDTGGPQTHLAFYLPHEWFDDPATTPDSSSEWSDIPLVTRGNIGAAIPADVEVCGDRLMTLRTLNISCTEIAAAFGTARFPRVASQLVATAWTSDDRRLSPHLPEQFGSSLETLGISDPHGDGGRTSNVHFYEGLLRDGEGVN